MNTLYDVLGAGPDDDAESLKNAFRNAVKESHPDLHPGDPDAPLRFRQIVRANAILSDAEQRTAYDRFLAFELWLSDAEQRAAYDRFLTFELWLSDAEHRAAYDRFLALELSQRRSDSKRSIVSDTMRNIAADAIAVAVLVVMLGGGYVLFTHVSKTSVATVDVVKVSAGESAEIAAVNPPARAGSIGRSEPRDKLGRLEVHDQAIVPSAPADGTSRGRAQAIADGKPAHIADVKPVAQTDTTSRDEPSDNPRAKPQFSGLQTEPEYHPKWGKLNRAGVVPGWHHYGSMPAKLNKTIGASASASPVAQADLPATTAAAPVAQAIPPKEEAATTGAVYVKPAVVAVASGPRAYDVPRQDAAATPPPAQALRLVEQQRAIADLDRAIRLDPNDAEAYNIRGNVWDDMGDADHALADYEQAIRIDPNNPGTFRDRGILWQRRGELDKALVDFDRAIRLSFSDPQIYSDRGLLWYEKGYHDRALADFRRAVKIDPDFAIAYINRGVMAHRRRDIDRASPELDQAIHVDLSVFDAIRRENLHP
jgi:tetratricopeptide (TPR) repeat protein